MSSQASSLSASGTLGVLMLDTRFPRVVGDIGNPASFAFAVRYGTVRGASPQRVVVERDASLLAPFLAAGEALVDEGATALTTSCGFLVLFQRALAAALPVPVWTSSLLLVAEVNAALGPGRTAGVVTVDAASLSADHLIAAGAPTDTPVEGLAPGCAFRRTLLENRAELDVESARDATVDAAIRLVARRPDVAAIVLECTNMPPYAAAVGAATGRPVHDITTLLAARFGAASRRAESLQ
ncbi:MAG: aspartate/glutamate racemase family protein [Caldimonas sp.]